MQKLTILCPCHNEEGVVALFFQRLLPVIEAISKRYAVDVVFLNNASNDDTLSQILALKNQWPSVYVLSLSRNVGYQASLEFGLRNVVGDIFICIDVDCEDPPELIPNFLHFYERGYDIVYGERVDRDEPRALVSSRKIFYRLLKIMADEEIILDMAEFALFTSEVRDVVVQDRSSFPFIRSSLSRAGFRHQGIPFKRHQRIGGRTHYNLLGMIIFAIAGILAASTLLLRLPLYFLPLWLLALLLLSLYYADTGQASALAALLFVAVAYLGIATACISLYVARSYKNSLGRPNAFMSRRLSYPQPPASDVPMRTSS